MTIASCTTNASGGSPWKCHAKGCKSERRQLKHPAPRFGWCFVFPHPSFPSRAGAGGGVSASRRGARQLGGLLHGNHSPDGNDQALFPESLTHLSCHSWQAARMTASMVLGTVTVSKAPVIPIPNGTLSALNPEEASPQPKPTHCSSIREGINSC